MMSVIACSLVLAVIALAVVVVTLAHLLSAVPTQEMLDSQFSIALGTTTNQPREHTEKGSFIKPPMHNALMSQGAFPENSGVKPHMKM
jgi:cell division protein YceG involved in septum cleavage